MEWSSFNSNCLRLCTSKISQPPLNWTDSRKASWQLKCRRFTQSQTHAPRHAPSGHFSRIGGHDVLFWQKGMRFSKKVKWAQSLWTKEPSQKHSEYGGFLQYGTSNMGVGYPKPLVFPLTMGTSIWKLQPKSPQPHHSVTFCVCLSPFWRASHLPKTQRFACFQKDHATFTTFPTGKQEILQAPAITAVAFLERCGKAHKTSRMSLLSYRMGSRVMFISVQTTFNDINMIYPS